MSGFTKLAAEITDSSIWNEDDKTRIVWITMLARQGPDSMVRASVGGLAHLARVSREDCEKALEILSSPDPDSRSSFKEGRRIEKVEGGFFIINAGRYRYTRNDDERREYMRQYMRNYREKNQAEMGCKPVNVSVNSGKQELTELAQEEAEKEAEKETLSERAEIPSLEDVLSHAEMAGIASEIAKKFYDWHEGNNYWLNRFDKLINWKAKLKNWENRERVYTGKPKIDPNTGLPPQIDINK